MKTNINILSYFAHFFLEWEMFHTKVVDKIKTHILFSVTFFLGKSCRLWDNVENYGRARQATDDNKTRCIHCACWINKGTDRETQNLWHLLLYDGNSGFANAP